MPQSRGTWSRPRHPLMPRFTARSRIEAPADRLFAWHERPGAFERLVAPWDPVRLVNRTGGLRDGDRAEIEMRLGPLAVRWIAVHRDYLAGRQFVDEQERGPFSRWRHVHRVLAESDTTSILEDDVEYGLPFGPAGRLADRVVVRRALTRLFRYRHAVTAADLACQRRYAGAPMRIAITGASGLVGSQLTAFLSTAGHEVVRLVRGRTAGAGTAGWSVSTGEVDRAALGPVNAVVHLAGAGIADRRWTDAYKREIRESRVGPTRALCEWLARLPNPPSVVVCASAIGYYGNRGDEMLTESSAPGTGFLADVCQEWERAAQPARDGGIRVVHLRLGVVLTPLGGALAKMLPAFRAGVGGPMGSGHQYMSWVSLDDVMGAAYHALVTTSVSGPANLTAPSAVTNGEFTAVLARVLRRPAVLRVPSFALRTLVGEMAGPLLLDGQRVLPRVLLDSGYDFRHPRLEDALRHVLGR